MKIVFFILYRALHLNEVNIALEWPRPPSPLNKRLRYHYTTDNSSHVYYIGVGVCKVRHNHNLPLLLLNLGQFDAYFANSRYARAANGKEKKGKKFDPKELDKVMFDFNFSLLFRLRRTFLRIFLSLFIKIACINAT